MGWLNTVLGFLQLVPNILKLIVDIEGVFQHSAAPTGSAKKAIVMSAISDAPASVQSKASTFIDTTVSTLNATGVFKTAKVA